VAATTVVGGVWFLSVPQLAIAACRLRCCIPHFWALLVEVTALTPQTTGRLFSLDMAEFLAVVTLRETSLGFVRLYLDSNVAKASIWKISCDLGVLGKVIRNVGGGGVTLVGPSVDDRRVVVICLTLMTSKPRFTNPSEMSSARVLSGRWHITALMGFRDLRKKV
jgi:hypothetical protein